MERGVTLKVVLIETKFKHEMASMTNKHSLAENQSKQGLPII